MANTTLHDFHISAGLKDYIDDLNFKRKHPKELNGISTGYDYLDMKLGGLKSGEVTIIGARPAMGKTTFANNLTYNIAADFYAKHKKNEQNDHCVVYVGLDCPPKIFTQRLISLHARIPIHKLCHDEELEENFTKILQAEKALDELPIYYLHNIYNVDDIIIGLKQIEKQKQISCVIIDYLQLLSEEYQVKEDYSIAMLQFKQLALKLGIPIVVLSQLKRDLETRADKRPLRCDIRGLSRNQNMVDNILFLYRESYYIRYNEPTKRKRETKEHYQKRLTEWQQRCEEVEDLCEIIIAKNTNGHYGSVKMHFDWSTGLFSERKQDF